MRYLLIPILLLGGFDSFAGDTSEVKIHLEFKVHSGTLEKLMTGTAAREGGPWEFQLLDAKTGAILDSFQSKRAMPRFILDGNYVLSSQSPAIKFRVIDIDWNGANEVSDSKIYGLPQDLTYMQVTETTFGKSWRTPYWMLDVAKTVSSKTSTNANLVGARYINDQLVNDFDAKLVKQPELLLIMERK